MAVLAHELPPEWLAAIRAAAPEVEILTLPEPGRERDIVAVVCAWSTPTRLSDLPALRLVQCVSAGVDHLTLGGAIPAEAAIARIVDPDQPSGMSEYVLLHVLRAHRQLDRLQRQAREARWIFQVPARARDARVGILGLGRLGSDAATKLAAIGFQVSGWSRTARRIEGVACHFGEAGLDEMLATSDHLVCLLPLTPDTVGILDRRVFAALPRGAFLINAGRGEHLVENDLLDALATGQLASATLDVMVREPVAPDHPFWREERILITPHSASSMDPRVAAGQVADNLRRAERGLLPSNAIDRIRGY